MSLSDVHLFDTHLFPISRCDTYLLIQSRVTTYPMLQQSPIHLFVYVLHVLCHFSYYMTLYFVIVCIRYERRLIFHTFVLI